MRVHVSRSHAARFVRLPANRAHKWSLIRMYPLVYRQFAGLRECFATVRTRISFAIACPRQMIALRFQREKQLVTMRTRKLSLGAFRFDVCLQFIERPMFGAAMLTAIRFAVNVFLLDVQCESHE